MEFTGTLAQIQRPDGYELRYRVWPASPARTTVVLFNGIMGHSGWFSALAAQLQPQGFHMVGADRRGSGPNREQRGDAPDAATLLADARAVIDAEHEPGGPLVLVGWCWGAALAVNLAATRDLDVDGLVLVTPGLFPSARVQENARAGLAQSQGQDDGVCCVPTPIEAELFSPDPAVQADIETDVLRLSLMTGRLARLGPKLLGLAAARLARVTVPSLLVLAEHDGATDNAAAKTAFAGPNAPSNRETKYLATHHGIVFEDPQGLARVIAEFIQRR